MIDLATTMINHDRPYDFMPRKAHPDAPITAYRSTILTFFIILSFKCIHVFLTYPLAQIKLSTHDGSLRYHSLHTRNGEDDMFSSDLSDKELKEKLGHMSATPSLVHPLSFS